MFLSVLGSPLSPLPVGTGIVYTFPEVKAYFNLILTGQARVVIESCYVVTELHCSSQRITQSRPLVLYIHNAQSSSHNKIVELYKNVIITSTTHREISRQVTTTSPIRGISWSCLRHPLLCVM